MSDERSGLILELKKVRDNGYKEDDVQKRRELTGLMLKYIGDPDPELRCCKAGI